jgi:hypothetical protein
MWTSRLIGALFLTGFVIYGTGSFLVTGLVPRWLAGPGLVVLLIPGAVFEVTLAIWLLVKGFTPAAYDAVGAAEAYA